MSGLWADVSPLLSPLFRRSPLFKVGQRRHFFTLPEMSTGFCIQLSGKRSTRKEIATPADWKPGEDVIIVPKVTNEEAKKIYPDGWKTIKPYLRKVPDPSK